ncbi:MAG: ABC transporter permease [Ruminococcus sp.]|nr:ABC transporter permease [Ruminococcus sp.]
MNIFHRVTLQSLRKNKTRTIVTIIGIILSTALICAVMISYSSLLDYMESYFIDRSGKWHGCTDYISSEKLDTVKNSDKIDEYTVMKEIGYAEIDGNSQYKPYLYIMALSGSMDDMVSIKVTAGKYPENAGEILIPEHLSSHGGITYKIGDTIELETGDRIYQDRILHQDTKNHIEHYENGNYSEEFIEEEFVPKETHTYTVSGFYQRPEFEEFTAPGYTAIVLDDGYSDDTVYRTYFTMKNPKNVYSFLEENELNGSTNYELLMLKGVTEFDGFRAMFGSMIAILIALIMFGSVSLIYNAFAISVSERTKQFGLLSSIGATRKQSRKMVFFEAFVVSAIGIPAGLIVGVVGIAITLSALGEKIGSVIGFDTPMKICITPFPIFASCIIAVATVMISAFIPSIRATKVTAVEAIRQSKDIKSKNKPIRTPKFVYKIFGLSGMLAQKYFKRSRKKYRATIMSLFMSIVLFISASAFSEYIMATIETPFGSTNKYDLDYCYFPNGDDIENNDTNYKKLLDIFNSDENITDVSYEKTYSTDSDISKSYLTDKFIESYGTEEDTDIISYIYTDISFIDDESFRKLLKDNNLNEEKFMNPENPLALVFDGFTVFDYESQKYIKKYIFNTDEFEFTGYKQIDIDGYYFDGFLDESDEQMYVYRSCDDREDVKFITKDEATEEINFKVGGVITEMPYWYRYGGYLPNLIYPYSFIEKIVPDGLDGHSLHYYMTSDNHKQSYENIKNKLSENSFDTSMLYDASAETEKEQNVVIIIRVFAYGFIILISLIACANVFNTITTNVNLRRREFAMLRSIGMTNKELRRMMNYECLMYGTKSLIFGLPVSFGMTFLIHVALHSGIENDFFIPWDAVAVAVFSVFAVVFATMLYSVSKIKSDNLIETLKNENI